VVTFALLGLAPGGFAQPGTQDPVDAFDEALQTLPPKERRKTLTELARNITTPGNIARALHLSRPRRSVELTRTLAATDQPVYNELLDRLVKQFQGAIDSNDATRLSAFITLIGGLPAKLPVGPEALVGDPRLVILVRIRQNFLPMMATLKNHKYPEVQLALARSLETLVQKRIGLTEKERKIIRDIFASIIKQNNREPSIAVFDAMTAFMRLFNPEPSENIIQPTYATTQDLQDLLTLLPAMVEGLKNADPEVRLRAAVAMNRLGVLLGNERQQLISTGLLDDPESEKKALQAQLDRVRESVKPIGEGIDTYRKILNDPNPELRILALRTVENLALIQSALRARIVQVQGSKSPPETPLDGFLAGIRAQVLENLATSPPGVRLSAAQAIEAIGLTAQATIDAMVRSLRDPYEFVRWVAARALSQTKANPAPATVKALARALYDPSLSVRDATATTLEQFGPKGAAAMPALAQVVNRGDARFREAAARAMGAIARSGEIAVPALARELTNPEMRVRKAAAQAIARFGKDASLAREALKMALNDPEPEVRQYASEALLVGN
jgi:HEAT repeat protein